MTRPCVDQPCDRDNKGRIRCSFHRSRHTRGQPAHGPTRRRPHKLESWDVEKRTGTCRVCGPVHIVGNFSKVNPGYKCGRSVVNGTLISKYKITIEQYEEILAKQNGVCRLCHQEETRVDNRYGAQARLAVDHDHSCCPGETSCGNCVRGLLCHSCNTGIGKLGDDPARLRAAADYLEEFRE